MYLFLNEKTLDELFSQILGILDSMTFIMENQNVQGKLLKNLLFEKVEQISQLLKIPYDKEIALLRKQAWIYLVKEQTLKTHAPEYAGIYRQNYSKIMNTIKKLDIPF